MKASTIAFSIIVLLAISCRSPSIDPDEDFPWLTPIPFKTHFAMDEPGSLIIEYDSIFEVPANERERAISMLETRAFVALSPEEARELLTVDPPLAQNESLFLVRAVSRNLPGSYQVVYRKRALMVFYGAMGSTSGVLKKTPVVLALPSTPKRVFVSTSVAE